MFCIFSRSNHLELTDMPKKIEPIDYYVFYFSCFYVFRSTNLQGVALKCKYCSFDIILGEFYLIEFALCDWRAQSRSEEVWDCSTLSSRATTLCMNLIYFQIFSMDSLFSLAWQKIVYSYVNPKYLICGTRCTRITLLLMLNLKLLFMDP